MLPQVHGYVSKLLQGQGPPLNSTPLQNVVAGAATNDIYPLPPPVLWHTTGASAHMASPTAQPAVHTTNPNVSRSTFPAPRQHYTSATQMYQDWYGIAGSSGGFPVPGGIALLEKNTQGRWRRESGYMDMENKRISRLKSVIQAIDMKIAGYRSTYPDDEAQALALNHFDSLMLRRDCKTLSGLHRYINGKRSGDAEEENP
jgi:hypothetical protein